MENAEQALEIAKAYVQKVNQGYVTDEVLEFANSYEVEVKDPKTSQKAYEFSIFKNGGMSIRKWVRT